MPSWHVCPQESTVLFTMYLPVHPFFSFFFLQKTSCDRPSSDGEATHENGHSDCKDQGESHNDSCYQKWIIFIHFSLCLKQKGLNNLCVMSNNNYNNCNSGSLHPIWSRWMKTSSCPLWCQTESIFSSGCHRLNKISFELACQQIHDRWTI